LRINNVATANLTEVGFFDTDPNSNNRTFNGVWSNYPFFSSGAVIASDIYTGLFVLKPTGVASNPANPTTNSISQFMTLAQNIPSQPSYETINGYDCLRTVKGTNETMIALKNDFPDLVAIMDIGYSYRVQDPIPGETGYTIRLVKITSPQGISEKAKVFVVAGVHAREYAPPEIVLRFAEKLAEGYGKDADISWILDHVEIYVLPIANPDARQIAETVQDFSGRKNRHFSGCSESSLDGVDLNRNFPFKYSEAGTSDDPCAENFRGSNELSEVESKAIFDFAESIFPDSQKVRGATVAEVEENIDMACGVDVTGVYLDLHSYGGLVHYPWGFQKVESPDDVELETMARKLASFGQYGLWGPGQPDFLYEVSGDTVDTMYGFHCVPSFAFEVGTDFYEECSQFEDEVFPTNYEALLYAAKVASAPFKISKGPDVLSLEIESTTSNSIIVTVVVSDEERSIAYGEAFAATGSQVIAMVRVFVDDHPYTISDPNAGVAMNPLNAYDFNSPTESASLEIDIESLSSGQHVVYVEAEDSDGFKGPISAGFFDVL
jgi:hypothetical protein